MTSLSPNPADKLILAVPSKGRLMEQTAAVFAAAGMTITKTGHERGYRGAIGDLDSVEVAYLSASEIALALRDGRVHLGVTGEDLLRETIPACERSVALLKPLGFGHADVIVAVPDAWIDVDLVRDLEAVAQTFRRVHGRRPRVATKYLNITRQFFNRHGVTSYLIVESLGATEGTPAAGTAELIVDITSTGSTLRANGLKILDDGVILNSQANLVASKTATWTPAALAVRDTILARFGI